MESIECNLCIEEDTKELLLKLLEKSEVITSSDPLNVALTRSVVRDAEETIKRIPVCHVMTKEVRKCMGECVHGRKMDADTSMGDVEAVIEDCSRKCHGLWWSGDYPGRMR